MATLTPTPKQQFFDANGNPLAGGKVYTYAAGTTTPLATYTDSSGTVPNTNPIILDSRGEAAVWLGSSAYKFKLTNSADVEVWTVDNIVSLDIQSLSASNGSSLIGFIQSGTGAVSRTVQSKLRDVISVKDFGAVGNGITDDTAAIQACLNAANSYSQIEFPGIFLVTSTVTMTGKNDITLCGGTIKTTANITALQISSCNRVSVELDFVGPVNNQQYEVVLSSANNISDLFNSYTQTELITNTPASSNSTVSKLGSSVTVALTSDAGLNINRGALSSSYAINANNRYVVFIDENFASGIATAAPRFYKDGSEWNPQYSTTFNYITGATSFQIKVGTGRSTANATYSSIAGYTGATYDINKISLLKLVNEAASFDFSSGLNSFVFFSNCNNVYLTNCNIRNGYIAAQAVSCNFVYFTNNNVAQCFAGLGTDLSSNVVLKNNNIDMRWLDNLGNYRDSVFVRFKGFSGRMNNQFGLLICDNTIKGACWGIEYTSSTPVYGAQITNNNLFCAHVGISVNYFKNAQISNNYYVSTNAFSYIAIEAADNSSEIQLVGNTCVSTNICGQANVGISPTGSNYSIKSNYIRAANPINKTSFTGPYSNIDIDGNTFIYGGTGIFIREMYATIRNNNIKSYTSGYIDGVGYTGTSAGVSVEMSINDSPNLISIRNNEIDGGLGYIGIVNFLRMDISNNIFNHPFNTLNGFFGNIYASATSSINHQFINNRLYSTGGYNPVSYGLIRINNVPAAGGVCVFKNQNSDMNVSSYSGAGGVIIYDGAFGGGPVTWNPGTIGNGSFAETTVAGVYGAYNCAYSVAPPYSTQGCLVYAYYDGTNTKLRIQNNTGGSVTFGSGNWKVMADRSRY